MKSKQNLFIWDFFPVLLFKMEPLLMQHDFLVFKRWFTEFKELDFARSGNIATYDLKLDAGIETL